MSPAEEPEPVRMVVILSHDLWTQAKAIGASERRSLQSLLFEGLLMVIRSRKQSAAAKTSPVAPSQ